MKCTIPEISWHNRDPVLSVDIQPIKANETYYRLASGGTDSHVLIWLLTVDNGGIASLECAADLTRHTKPVNCVRFSPSGEFLSTGDDEACVIIWKMKTGSDPLEFPMGEEENFKEQWISVKVLRGHLQDVYDLSWSTDSKHLISGSVDNTAIMWDVSTGKNQAILSDHRGFVQGVAWDPCGQYVATISSDRVCRVYNTATRRVVCRMRKGLLPGAATDAKPSHLFHDDTLKSFFRRLCFSPDGELLIVPSALVEQPGETPTNATLLYSRHALNKPLAYLPSLSQYSVAVRCCPVLFALRPMSAAPPLLPLPYRVVVAVATQCSVILYDTQHAAPFAFITKIHYTRLTDLTWSSDGRILVVSSTDGYCSVITFAENELGTVYKPEKVEEKTEVNKAEKTVSSTESKGKEIKKTEEEINSGKVVLSHSEDANMPMGLSSDEIKPRSSTGEENAPSKKTSQLSGVEKNKKRQTEESTMEVDDFQLVYETTVPDPVLEKKLEEAEPAIPAELNKSKLEKDNMDVDNESSKEVESDTAEPSIKTGTSEKKQAQAKLDKSKPQRLIGSDESRKSEKCQETISMEVESGSSDVKKIGDKEGVKSSTENVKEASKSTCEKETSKDCSKSRSELKHSEKETGSGRGPVLFAPSATKSTKEGAEADNLEVSEKKQVEKTESNNGEKSTAVLPMESPVKSAGQESLRPEMTSPQPNRSATTPGNSSKKTPRRVQLITLSSPKSKKQLLP